MLTTLFHKICAFAMAILVFVSTTSFAVQKRYCHEDLIKVSVFDHLETCDSKTLITLSHEQVETKCCTDEIDVFQGQETLKDNTQDQTTSFQKNFIVSFTFSFGSFIRENIKPSPPDAFYSPPILTFDRQIHEQVFLI